MGTTYQVTFAAASVDLPGLSERLHSAVTAVDDQMSTWKPHSDLSRFNAAPPGDWWPVPADLARVVLAGLQIGRASSGAFNIALGDQVAAWGFGAHGGTGPSETPPGPAHTDGIEARLDPPALRKSAALSLDLSGIAKGFGVDQLAAVLEQDGVTDYLISIDGEVRASGRKPDLEGNWRLALEAPIPGQRQAWDILEPRDCAIATSGDYRHFHVHNGKTLSHTIDPRTAAPVDTAIASVTVCDASCMNADAWATALMVLGPHDGVALAQARNIPALFLLRDDAGLREIATGSFDALRG
jgi:FAD:protein FMN transferase